jgi:tetratricopeptide (TPR) repeat protein
MMEVAELDNECFRTTDGEIAIANLNSARLRSWSRFFQNPLQPGVAEILIEQEQLTAQFVGDLSALDRVESLTRQLVESDAGSARTALIQAQVASMLHRFSDARHYLVQAELGGAPSAGDVKRLRLSIDQACGLDLGAVMDERRKIAAKSGRLEDLVALGALLADLNEFPEADHIYRQALCSYSDVSPFAVAWVCFQLGVLWGELASEPDLAVAEQWYRKAIACLPGYVKAGCTWPRSIQVMAGQAMRRTCWFLHLRAAIRRCAGGWLTS